MALFTRTHVEYYNGRQSFTGDGTTTIFTISNNENAFPENQTTAGILEEGIAYKVFIDGSLYAEEDISVSPTVNNYEIKYDTGVNIFDPAYLGWYIEFDSAPTSAAVIEVEIVVQDFGNYQFTSLEHIINNFMIAYVGEGKVISKTHRTDVQFHAMRALQELSFDTFKSTKSQEITIPPSLTMILPHDYVNYVKLTFKDSAGIEHIIYPTSKTSNPFNPKQNSDGSFSFDPDDDGIEDREDLIPEQNSDTWDSYKSATPSENNKDSYIDNTYWTSNGQRYGLDPQHAQVNGSFFIDELKGLIHFSSNMNGKIITLKYISDSLGTDKEMKVHKLAEEAMYKWIAYAILSTRANTPEYVINRYKKERFAETRKAKLRLSNIKLEEITRILRGKSKWIKH